MASIRNVLSTYEVELVIVCIRNIEASVMREILKSCNRVNIQCQTIPSLTEVNDDKIDVSRLRDVSIEDLLGRETVRLDDSTILKLINYECILVTGAGGSIGSELCRQSFIAPSKKISTN